MTEAVAGDHPPEVVTSTPRTTYVDVTDLIAHLRLHETVSGLQSVQCQMLGEALDGNVDRSLCFVVLDEDRGLRLVETTALLDLIELVRSPSASRLDVDHKLVTLVAGMAPPFVRPHDLFLAIGAFWAVNGVGTMLQELKNAGAAVALFLHDSAAAIEPACGDVNETRRAAQRVIEALTLADVIVTTSADDKASVAGYVTARQLPPSPIDVVAPVPDQTNRDRRCALKDVLDVAHTLARRVPPFDGVAALTLPANRYLPVTSDGCDDGGPTANLACISGWKRPESWGVWADQPTAMLGFLADLPVGTSTILVLRLVAPGGEARMVSIVTESAETEITLAPDSVAITAVRGVVGPGHVVSARFVAPAPYGGLYLGLQGIEYFGVSSFEGRSPESTTQAGGDRDRDLSSSASSGRVQLRAVSPMEEGRAASYGAFLKSTDSLWPMEVDDLRGAPLFADRTDRQSFLMWHADKVGAVTDAITLIRRSDQFVAMSRYSEGSVFDRSGVGRGFGYLHTAPPTAWLSKDVDSVWVDEADLARAPRLDHPCLVFFNGNMQNYYHWMAEGLLSLHVLSQAMGPDPTLHIALPKRMINEAVLQYRESIRAVGLDHYSIDEVEADVVRVREAIWAESDLVRLMPARCLKDFQRSVAARYADVRGPRTKRLLVARTRAARAIQNLREVQTALAPHGFETVYLDNMSVADQIVLFQSADFVIGPHGAGLTNLLFCEPGTKVIEFVPADDIRPHFWLISEKLDLVHGLQCCGTAGASGYDASVVVDITKLQALYRIVDAHG